MLAFVTDLNLMVGDGLDTSWPPLIPQLEFMGGMS